MVEMIILLVSGVVSIITAGIVAWSVLSDTWSIWPVAVLFLSLLVLFRGLYAQTIRGDRAQ